jgi:methyl-accepting chemotaxis protein
MKLRVKLLLLPAIGGASLVALCVLVTLMQLRSNRELSHLADVRFEGYASAYRIEGELSSMHAEAYRTILWIDTLQAAVVKGRRDALVQRGSALGEKLRAMRGEVDAEGVARLDTLAAATAKYAKAVDDAIDMASVDANTGLAAMQTADAQYKAASRVAAELLETERRLATDSVVAAKTRDQRNLMVLWIATAAALLCAFGFSVVFNRRLLVPLNAAREAADSIAAGDLRVRLPEPPNDEIGQLISALRRMSEHLSRTLGSIKDSTEQIATASTEIAVGNNDLSRRTEQQASNLQQTSSSMEQLTGTVATNADSARQANQLALGASEVARRGGEVVEQVVATMGEISDSSRKIADIISVIDGIAFQTNILALNAAVEAARAGEQGRGFAVVAGEVRSLAQRSAEAARQIKGLITDSVERVDSGSRLVKDAGSTMSEIVTSVRRVTDIIGEISSATGEQSAGIGQVNTAVNQLDRMTQQNAALVEQSAAAAESLKEQARRLAQAVDAFRLDDGSRASSGPSPARSTPAQPVADAGKGTAWEAEPTLSMPSAPAPAARPASTPKSHGHAATPAAPAKPAAATRPAAVAKPSVTKATPAKASGAQPSAVKPATARPVTPSLTASSSAPPSAPPSAPSASTAPAPAPAPKADAPAPRPVAAKAEAPPRAAAPAPKAEAPPRAAAPAPKAAKVPDDDWEEF